MRQHTVEGFRRPLGGLTSFPIVPIASIPVFENPDGASAFRPLVLVVDAEPDSANMLAEILDRNGYAAIPAYDADSALEIALLVPPELAVIDAGLSRTSGMDLAESLRGSVPDCRILMVSKNAAKSELLATVKAAHVEPRLI